MKSIDDAMILRNHVINMLEQADVENKDEELKRSLITFVVVGGGFSGVETVGEPDTKKMIWNKDRGNTSNCCRKYS